MNERDTDRRRPSENSIVNFAGNPPVGALSWLVTVSATMLIFLLMQINVNATWLIFICILIIAIRIFTAIFPPRAYALWRDRTDVGKFGRKFARNWRRIIPGLTPVSTGVVVRRHYPGLVSATEENNQLILTIRYPNERPSGGLAKYAEDIAEAFHDAYQFASVTVRPGKPGARFNRFKLVITPADMTEEVREWNAD